MAASHRPHAAAVVLDATPLLRAHGRRRLAQLARQDAAETQRRTLTALLRRAARTRFGQAHDFASIGTVEAYQRRVPLRDYDAFWTEWWRDGFPLLDDRTWPGRIACYANSSGTSGGPTKRIPVTAAMRRSNRQAALDVLVHYVSARPDSRLLAGRSLMLGGSTALERLAPGVVAGDLSGIAAADVPLWAAGRMFPPRDVALLGDWGRKMAAIAPASLTAEITSISGTPSWMLLFFERVAALGGSRRLADLYPALELVIHGGIGFAPYRDRFAAWLDGGRATTREVYAASEGFVAVADRGDGDGMRLLLDRGLFFEFVRAAELGDPTADRRWIADAELGVEYALVLTTNAGLWSYVIGDTVTLVDRAPPRVLVSGRVGWSLSVAGEHLIGAELDAGMAAAATALGEMVIDYTAAPIPPDAGDPRAGHLFVVELDGPAEAGAFARALDADLARRNEDYAAHRHGDVGMRPPTVRLVPAGTFERWMAARGKLGGQNKVPRVLADAGELLRFLDRTSS